MTTKTINAAALTEQERDLALLNDVKAKFDLTDSDLAEMLGINKSDLSKIRSQVKAFNVGMPYTGTKRTLTTLQRMKAFDRLGYAWAREALMTLFPDAVRRELVSEDNARTRDNVVRRKKKESAERELGVVK